MPANNTDGLVHWLAGKAPESIGHLYTPNRTERPKSWLPYALDNGAYSAAINKREFDWKKWGEALDRYCHHAQPPLWLVVPDVIFDGEQTLRDWMREAPKLKEYGVPLALAVQDGMLPTDVDKLALQPDVIFVGGSTEWKWATAKAWCASFPRVHVARVNGRKGLDICKAAGAESCDGSGWFRGRLAQIIELVDFVSEHNGLDVKECRLAAESSRHLRCNQSVLRLEDE